jgi:hypothetical protein
MQVEVHRRRSPEQGGRRPRPRPASGSITQGVDMLTDVAEFRQPALAVAKVRQEEEAVHRDQRRLGLGGADQ